MPLIKLNKTERRKVAVFISCLAIAVFAWLFFALSKQYEYSIKTPVDYINLPQNKAFHPLQSDTVTLQIEGTGWKLLFSKLRLMPQTVKVNLKSLANRNYVTFSEQLRTINRSLPSSQRIVSVMPDTLYFDFSSRSVKRVPVTVLYQVKFQPGFNISDSINITPSHVTVTGPIDDIDDIRTWDTDTLHAKEVKSDVNARVALIQPSKNVTIYPSVVEVQLPVSEFTEKSLNLPVAVINNEKNFNVKLLPSKVKITFLVSLHDYANIKRDDFLATADLRNWSEKNYTELPVVLEKIPPFCKVVKIEPEMLDFIIE